MVCGGHCGDVLLDYHETTHKVSFEHSGPDFGKDGADDKGSQVRHLTGQVGDHVRTLLGRLHQLGSECVLSSMLLCFCRYLDHHQSPDISQRLYTTYVQSIHHGQETRIDQLWC